MGLTYFKRFRMEIDLRGRDFSNVCVPQGFYFVPWSAGILEAHAEVKFHSFRAEIDSNVFPCLGEYAGCVRLMEEIASKPGFLAQSTWLVAQRSAAGCVRYSGTVQGVVDRNGMGSIQNLGIVPEQRGRGLGTALMQLALAGFQNAGLRRAFLEVTAQNSAQSGCTSS